MKEQSSEKLLSFSEFYEDFDEVKVAATDASKIHIQLLKLESKLFVKSLEISFVEVISAVVFISVGLSMLSLGITFYLTSTNFAALQLVLMLGSILFLVGAGISGFEYKNYQKSFNSFDKTLSIVDRWL